jgi:D-hydroxyproline dehydrogenase subunit beta
LLGHYRLTADVLVIGAGIIGAACAQALHAEGMKVALVEANFAGAGVTAAGMGHLVVLDESPDELDLGMLSMRLWKEFADANPGLGEFTRGGTLWVAEDEQQLARAGERAARLRQCGWPVEEIAAADMNRLEPLLRPGLAGGLRVESDAVVYAPAVAYAICGQLQQQGCALHLGERVAALESNSVVFENGSRLSAQHIVVATGPQATRLLPDAPVFARKGHLAITDRYPGLLTHQVVSMNYGQSSGGADGYAVAANVQPRPTGQWLVGSSRQEGNSNPAIDRHVLRAVLDSAIGLIPALAGMRISRSWTGMRPATPDGHPLIGPHASRPGVWLALGHEGLGITTCFATARLLADQIAGRASEIDVKPYLPARFAENAESAHVH